MRQTSNGKDPGYLASAKGAVQIPGTRGEGVPPLVSKESILAQSHRRQSVGFRSGGHAGVRGDDVMRLERTLRHGRRRGQPICARAHHLAKPFPEFGALRAEYPGSLPAGVARYAGDLYPDALALFGFEP